MSAEPEHRKILVVEDSLLIAEDIRDALVKRGFKVVGPASRVSSGMKLAREHDLDAALLDINLAGEFCFPIAAALAARQVPFLFLSGYDDLTILPPEYHSVPRISKPFDGDQLAAAIKQHLSAQG